MSKLLTTGEDACDLVLFWRRLSVCQSVCHTVTCEILDLESLVLVHLSLGFVCQGHRVKVKVTRLRLPFWP